jgi:hypothetical protein
MPINNPPGEQHEEQLRMHAEALRDELPGLKGKIADILVGKEYAIRPDGSISHMATGWELSKTEEESLAWAEKRLKEVAKELGPDAFKKALGGAK